jgi:HEAT repeat protein
MLTRERAENVLAYVGPVGKLGNHAEAIVAGKEVVITALCHRGEGVALYNPVAYRTHISGPQYPIWRLRASLKMPSCYITLTEPNCPWVVGLGAGTKENIGELIQALRHPNPNTRAEAADELGILGKEAGPALAALRERLADENQDVRAHAAAALLRMGLDAKPAVKVLTEHLTSSSAGVRRDAARFLAQASSEAATVVPLLVRVLEDQENRVRRCAAESLGQFGSASASAVPALIKLLETPAVAEEAAQALGAIGTFAKPAVPALTDAIRRAAPGSRGAFARALARIAPDASRPAAAVFLQELQSSDHRDRWDAVVCFRLLGPAAAAEVPALAELLRGNEAGPRAAVARVLADLGPHAAQALPVLITQLGHSDVIARRQALDVLTNMPKEARPAVPALVASLKDQNRQYAEAVARALKLIDPKTAAMHGIK